MAHQARCDGGGRLLFGVAPGSFLSPQPYILFGTESPVVLEGQTLNATLALLLHGYEPLNNWRTAVATLGVRGGWENKPGALLVASSGCSEPAARKGRSYR